MNSTKIKIAAGLLLTGLLTSPLAFSAVPKAQMEKPARILRGSGVATGGQSGTSLSLMDFRRTSSKQSRSERIVLDFGGADLQASKGIVGYYHAELQDKPARLILELPQTYSSRLPEKEILERLKNSLYVKKSSIQFDTQLQSMTMIFQLSQPVQVKITPVRNPKYSGKIVLDMAPLKVAKADSKVRAKAKAK